MTSGFNLIASRVVEHGDRVLLCCDCPEHGCSETVVCQNAAWFRRMLAITGEINVPAESAAATPSPTWPLEGKTYALFVVKAYLGHSWHSKR